MHRYIDIYTHVYIQCVPVRMCKHVPDASHCKSETKKKQRKTQKTNNSGGEMCENIIPSEKKENGIFDYIYLLFLLL